LPYEKSSKSIGTGLSKNWQRGNLMKNRATRLSVMALLMASAGCNSSNAPIDAAVLLETRCGVCHSTDIPKSARKSKSDWQETVSRMIAKGAKISPEEKKLLVKHLAKHYRR
jgi:hypothetical protein